MKAGDIIQFGNYGWRVLEVRNDAALIITEEVVEKRVYHTSPVDITWAECDMRKYLNGEFYGRFKDEEKSRILMVKNETSDNPWYGTKGGDDTKDYVFNLTFEDVVCKYFGDSSGLLNNRGKNQKYWFERKDPNNYKRVAMYNGKPAKWQLRTPGRYQNRVACIGADETNPNYIHNGSAHITGNPVWVDPSRGKAHLWDFMGIRPALWLRI